MPCSPFCMVPSRGPSEKSQIPCFRNAKKGIMLIPCAPGLGNSVSQALGGYLFLNKQSPRASQVLGNCKSHGHIESPRNLEWFGALSRPITGESLVKKTRTPSRWRDLGLEEFFFLSVCWFSSGILVAPDGQFPMSDMPDKHCWSQRALCDHLHLDEICGKKNWGGRFESMRKRFPAKF